MVEINCPQGTNLTHSCLNGKGLNELTRKEAEAVEYSIIPSLCNKYQCEIRGCKARKSLLPVIMDAREKLNLSEN